VFSSISRRYDLANRVISFGMDVRWRHDVVRMVAARKPGAVLDLATGSGDLAFNLCRGCRDVRIIALDFCEPMLAEARRKQAARPWASRIEFGQGDILALDLPDESFDIVTIGWACAIGGPSARPARDAACAASGGALYCLEFSQPYAWLRRPYYLYMNNVLPLLARVVTGDKSAYDYLAGTVAQFPGREDLAAQMRAAGFAKVNAFPRMGSIIAIHEAVKGEG
jgi:demethylmenaquinone methyltransferase/2-methoxy-6-polyprenyl-1,4-benzoquinol methylase